ncbi:MAG: aminotransferase class I/II-fold pyridoxal phosphate-dependent enzyme [Streptosporangiales bacterium]|nr:aminotransferase class I/II-fold pyridoxal phosphate-dependent enzyme [Streptosporangiales bacterium]
MESNSPAADALGPARIPAADLAAAIDEPTAKGIAAGVDHLVRTGRLRAGTALPTVRALATALRMSPTTVAEAWRVLSSAGTIETLGRRGTFVTGWDPTAYLPDNALGRKAELLYDLRLAVPEPEFLPDMRRALARAADYVDTGLNEYHADQVIGPLVEYAQRTWPFPFQRLTCAYGGYDALFLLCEVLIKPGRRVVVENPTSATAIEIIEALGGEMLPVPCDDKGMLPEQLRAALAKNPAAVLVQPRCACPDGRSLTPARAKELATAIAKCPAKPVVIEDDAIPELAQTPPVTLGTRLPDQVVHIRGWSKSHGPDLRLALIGGAADIVERAIGHRQLGAVWTSRLLQGAFAAMLADAGSRRRVAKAAGEYTRRRELLADALAARGVPTYARDGLALWVPVHDERTALVELASHGLGAGPGSRFALPPIPGGDHLRVATSRLRPEDAETVADLLAAAGRPRSSRMV